ncbi:unnamed protein product [Urochloa humidicola]
MANAMVSAAFSVVGKALAPLTNPLLKDWAASVELGSTVQALELELLSVKALLEPTLGKDIDNSALKELLVMMQELGYDAEDALDELDYFRIQDELDGTFEAADKHAKGFAHNLALNAKAVCRHIACLPACLSNDGNTIVHTVGKCFPCLPLPSDSDDNVDDDNYMMNSSAQINSPNDGPPKLSFNRVDVSKIIESDSDDDHNDDGNDDNNGMHVPLQIIHTNEETTPTILCFYYEEDSTHILRRRNQTTEPRELRFEVDASNSKGIMQHIVEQLRLQKILHSIQCVGKCFPCSCLPSVRDYDDDNKEDKSMHNSPQRNHTNGPPKLSFNRVDASTRMQHIVEQLRLVQQKVSAIITALGSNNWSTVPNIIAQSRPITTSESIEPKLYGRDCILDEIIHDITEGKHSGEFLTVIPIVGPGGIGKTTLAQHIYHTEEVQKHFEVRVWTCVSLNFDVNRLIEEIGKYIPKVDGERIGSAGELIEQRLKNKRLLLVLDDIWDCSNEDEWKRLLLPFKKSQVQGNIIIVTTRFPAQKEMMIQRIDHSICLQGLEHKEFKELFLDFVFANGQSRKNHMLLLEETGDKIVDRLDGSPLAAKTVGRLLKKQLDLVHWTRVLESKEWEQKDGKDDIMPALKLSYDYLPSQLQQCFYYCALFPQDYKFDREELINFWIGLDVLHSSHGENKRVEDIGLSHLTQLVNHGFFENEEKKDGSTCYIIHDLLHELARRISSHECLSIESSRVRSVQFPPSIRHLSINIDDTSVEDRLTIKNCLDDLYALDKRLKVEKLRSLMLFGEHHGCFLKALGDLFKEAKALRVVFLSQASYDVEDLLHNLYDLVHLRYLRIQSSPPVRTRFPNKVSRFYHMMVLDAKHCDVNDLPRDMSNLANLRHFLVRNDTTHSSIVEVGKLKSLQELRRFVVKQEYQGFELRQIGKLVELCGSLCISNIENVQAKEEADEAKLMQKSRLHELILCWNIHRSTNDSALEEHVLERLKPSSNLLKLSIIGHGGATCPSWLGTRLSLKSLEYLCLDGVAWKTFPPIGELRLVNVPREKISGKIPDKRFVNLRRLELVDLTWLKRWAIHAPCLLIPLLEVLIIRRCFKLVKLSFSHLACCQQERDAYGNLFPRLSRLEIGSCPRLLSFPPVPWTEAPCSIEIEGTGSSCLHKLVYAKNSNSEYCLTIEGKDTPDSTLMNVLDFHNLTTLKELRMLSCHPMALHHMQMLSSLRTLRMSCSSNAFPFAEGDRHVKYQFLVEVLTIDGWSASGKELTQLLTHFPKLSELKLWSCQKITGLSVMEQPATATTGLTSSTNREDEAHIEQHQQHDERVEDLVTLAAEGLLLLPPQLQKLGIVNCPELRLLLNPLEDNQEDGQTRQEGGLQGLSSLQWLRIIDCPKFLSSYLSPSFSCFPFPNSLEYLRLEGMVGMETMEPLSNLSSLTTLSVAGCVDLRGEGLLPFLAQGHLTKLYVAGTPVFFYDSELSRVHEQEHQYHSSKLQELSIDDVAGVTASPLCSLLHSSLTTLNIFEDEELECLTKDQETLLFVNSLEEISFMLCSRLQNLPLRVHSLPNLKRLYIWECQAIQMLPNLPSSLQELVITGCPEILTLPKDSLPSSLQKLVIKSCPAIQGLPKVDDLPSSLRELDVRDSRSEELRWQCRELIGIIPIVRA